MAVVYYKIIIGLVLSIGFGTQGMAHYVVLFSLMVSHYEALSVSTVVFARWRVLLSSLTCRWASCKQQTSVLLTAQNNVLYENIYHQIKGTSECRHSPKHERYARVAWLS